MVSLQDSFAYIEELKEEKIAALPTRIDYHEKLMTLLEISSAFKGIEMHVGAIYGATCKLELGENLSGLIEYKGNIEYRRHLEGITRHLMNCHIF